MKPFKIRDEIYWIGAVDYTGRDFHGYSLSPQGTTYNAYLVMDEKNTLFDTVRADFADALLGCLVQALPPEKVDYIVVSHAEQDHSGALPQVVEVCRPEKIFCSPMGKKVLDGYYNTSSWPLEVVRTGDTISIGKRRIRFLEAPMLHWPDSMFSYIPEERMLISNDAFGQNIACSERFFDQVDRHLGEHCLKEYYYNIVQPFASQVRKTAEKMAELGMDAAEILAPDHGLIFRTRADVSYALDRYATYASSPWKNRAVVIYDTMWHSTEKMAEAIAEGLVEGGTPTRIMWMKANHHSAVMTEVADSGAVIVGSPTHNNNILPLVADMLTYMKGLRPQNKIGAAFGSFGWSGESPRVIQEWLSGMGFALPMEPLGCKFMPRDDMFNRCRALGQNISAALQPFCPTTEKKPY